MSVSYPASSLLLGCSPAYAVPRARAAVHEWKLGPRELQQVLSKLKLACDIQKFFFYFWWSIFWRLQVKMRLCYFLSLLHPVFWLLCGITRWKSSTRWHLSIRSRRGSWCSAKDCCIRCRLVPKPYCSLDFCGRTLSTKMSSQWLLIDFWWHRKSRTTPAESDTLKDDILCLFKIK